MVLGCELVAAVRALRIDPERTPGPRLLAAYEAAAAVLGEERTDRPFDADLEAAVRLVESGL